MGKNMRDCKEKDLRCFAVIIDTSDNRKQMLQRLNGLLAGYKRGKNVSQTTVDRISALENLIIKFR
jgi:hypothetical protein